LIDNVKCDCDNILTMSHIVENCPLTKFDSSLQHLHTVDKAAVNWPTSYACMSKQQLELELY